MTNQGYRKLSLSLIGVWAAAATFASARHVFVNDAGGPPLALLASFLIPILAFLLWFTLSPKFRRFIESISPRTLTMSQTWRVNGFVFLILAAFGMLPAMFAIPAGLGDMAIGATAPWIARRFANRERRRGFVTWQALGILDLLMAIGLGSAANLLYPLSTSTGIMTTLPMSIVPTFLVPLWLIFHLICIAQAVGWVERYCPERVQATA
jgi:hypothetical protein